MSAISGIISYQGLGTFQKEEINKMMIAQKKRGDEYKGVYYSLKGILGQQKLVMNNDKLPVTRYDCQKSYTIVYDGTIYNKKELKNELLEKGYLIKGDSDEEIILYTYIYYKEECLLHLDGIFAFAIFDGTTLFLARDKFGLKPLYYQLINNHLIFASSIKGILAHKDTLRVIDKEGFINLYALGPMSEEGKTPFKDIMILKSGEYLNYTINKLTTNKYYHLPLRQINDSFEEAKIKVKDIIIKTVKKYNEENAASFLSGGLDSSIVATIMSENKLIDTYYLDYQDNQINFTANNFQRSRDIDTARLMANKLNSHHHELIINSKELFDELLTSADNRGIPGMADIDASLFWLAKKIAVNNKVILSGECADEVFGGYPWCYRKETDEGCYFPWLRNIDTRIKLLKKELQEFDFKGTIKKAYEDTIKNIEYLDDEDEESKKWRKMTYLNLYWFGYQLLIRNDTQTINAGLDARCPFAEPELIEYVYNLPYQYKYQNNQEKYLLREAFIDLLPEELVNRKKNPFPKTFDPNYFQIVSNSLLKALEDDTSILNKLFEKDKLIALINNNKKEELPWFGQLMTTPQLIGYLLQLDYLQKEYNIKFDL